MTIKQKKTIAIAGTGEAGKTAVYHAGEMNVESILETIPMIQNVADIETVQLFNVDSNEMDEEKWITLANQLNELAARPDIDGIVVTHGTDTLDETAYFLNLTVYTQKPVVLTGAMRPAFNLYQAVCLAASDDARGQGVMAVFSNTIYSGRDIQKVNNYKTDAFDQNAFGCLGYMQDETAYFFSRSFKTHTMQSIFALRRLESLAKVAVVYFYAGADEKILDYLAETHEGIVIVGSGSGNYNRKWMKMMEKLAEKGTVFVRASRVSQGIVFDDRVFDPMDVCIGANTLSGQKARVLLMLALTITKDVKQIRNIFNQY